MNNKLILDTRAEDYQNFKTRLKAYLSAYIESRLSITDRNSKNNTSKLNLNPSF